MYKRQVSKTSLRQQSTTTLPTVSKSQLRATSCPPKVRTTDIVPTRPELVPVQQDLVGPPLQSPPGRSSQVNDEEEAEELPAINDDDEEDLMVQEAGEHATISGKCLTCEILSIRGPMKCLACTKPDPLGKMKSKRELFTCHWTSCLLYTSPSPRD